MSHTFYFQHPETKEVAEAKDRSEMLRKVSHLFLSRGEVAETIGRSDLPIGAGITKMASGQFGEPARIAAERHQDAELLVETVTEYFEFISAQGVYR